MLFEDEDKMRDILIKWLQDNNFSVKKSVYVKTFEIDVGALARAVITRGDIKSSRTTNVFAFEAKIATTPRLARDVVEQAIVRLLVADYVYIVVPSEAEVWKNETTKEKIRPGMLIRRFASGVYSKNIGIITIDPHGNVEVVREAKKSGLVINELKNIVIKELSKTISTKLF